MNVKQIIDEIKKKLDELASLIEQRDRESDFSKRMEIEDKIIRIYLEINRKLADLISS